MKRWWMAAVAVVGVFALGASSCHTAQPYSTTSTLPKLQFAGDSITVAATKAINAHYGRAYNVAIEAMTGTDTWAQAANIAKQAALHPSVMVVNLGTNDTIRIGSKWVERINGHQLVLEPAQTMPAVLGRFDAVVSRFAQVSPDTCLVFVNVNTHVARYSPARARTINRHLAEIAAHLVDWNGAWRARYFPAHGGVHPNAAGRRKLFELLDETIAGCPGT